MNFLFQFLWRIVFLCFSIGFCLSEICTQTPSPTIISNQTNVVCEALPAQPVERQMSGAQTDCYQFDLAKDYFFQVRVEQRGIDIALKVFNTTGKPIAAVDSPNGTRGFENLSLIASEAGIYKLEIVSSDEKATEGKYVVLIEARRTATAKDRTQIEAQTTFAQAAKIASSSPPEALKAYQEAAELFRQSEDQNGEAKTYTEAGVTALNLNDRVAALSFFEKALTLFKTVADERETAKTLKHIGEVYAASGDNKKALEKFEQALPLFRDSDKLEKADTLGGIGNSYLRLSEYPKALENYQQALVLFRTALYPQGEADTLSNIGLINLELGQKQKALENFKQALVIVQKNGFKPTEVLLLNNIGRAYDDLGEQPKALENFNLALSLTDSKEAKASILISIGKISYDTGNNREALARYQESLQLFREINNKFGEITVLNAIGSAYSRTGEKPKALEHYHLALQLYRSFGSKRGEAVTLNNLMAISELSGNRRMAIFYGKQSVNAFQEIRAAIQKLDEKSQRSFIKMFADTYRRLAGILIEEGRLAEAQQVLILLKNEESFQYTRGKSDSLPNSSAKLDLNAEETEAAQTYRNLTEESSQTGQRVAALELEKSHSPLTSQKQAELQKLQANLTSSNTDFLQALAEKFSQPKPRNNTESATGAVEIWQKKLAALGKDTVLLTTLITESRYYVIMTTADTQTAKSFDISSTDLNKKLLYLSEVLKDPKTDVLPATQELYRILVKPIEPDLQQLNAKTLLWSLDGALRYVPFAALHDEKAFLVEKYTNIVVTLAQPPADSPSLPQNWRVLGAGVSNKIENFPALPNVPNELKTIVRDETAKNPALETKGIFVGKRLLNQDFTRANFTNLLEQKFQLVHLSTHFKLSPGKDADSFLLLGDGDRVNLAELQTNKLFDFTGVDLLTLSACETALGTPDANGVEIESFGVIAQRRGAKTVMATLWSIADNATPQLMTEFYRQYQKGKGAISKAEALRLAQITFLKKSKTSPNYAHPAFWAAFIVLGEWR